MMMRSPRGRLIAVLATLVLVAVAVGALVLMTRSEDESVPGQVGSVNGIAFTEEELAEARAAIGTNLDFMRGQVEDGNVAMARMDGYIALVEESDPDAMALAGIIVELAMYSEAVHAGATATDTEIAEEVNALRRYVESQDVSLADIDPALQSQFDSLGEERFWGEYYPEQAERSITIQNYVEQQSRDDGVSEMLLTRADLERQAVAEAGIDAPGDLDAALAFLDRYWEWSRSQAAQAGE
jgi:hypothetical protein